MPQVSNFSWFKFSLEFFFIFVFFTISINSILNFSLKFKNINEKNKIVTFNKMI